MQPTSSACTARCSPGVARVDSSFVLRSVVKNAGLPIDS
jgi:hypothetical protein